LAVPRKSRTFAAQKSKGENRLRLNKEFILCVRLALFLPRFKQKNIIY